MAISINGNGTITGLSTGGLPDGCVDTDTLANGAATQTKRTYAAGEVVQIAYGFLSGNSETTLYSILAIYLLLAGCIIS